MIILKKIIKWGTYILFGLSLIIIISLQVYKAYLKNTTEINTPNGISSLEEIVLGDLKQWIFIRSADQNNPVLIFLHGGPGAPVPGIASSRKLDANLIEHFTIVHWDQRGAGKSYDSDIPIASMTYERLVEDCNELIDYLRNRFNTPKVFIIGYSSGSIIGIKTAQKYPEKIYSYIGVGQIINDYEGHKISYKALFEEAEKSGDLNLLDELKAIRPPYDTAEELNKKNEYIFNYGGVVHRNSIEQILSLQLNFLTSPEYSLSEGFSTILLTGYDFSIRAMLDEISGINITKDINFIDVPLYFVEGKYDLATPTQLAKNFFDSIDAEKGKKLFILENSAHFPMLEEREKYEDILINIVLKDSQHK